MDVKEIELLKSIPALPKPFRREVVHARSENLGLGQQGNAKGLRKADTKATERLSYLFVACQALTDLHCTHRNMESLLQTASRLVVDILDLDHCSIGWLDKTDMAVKVWTGHTPKGRNANTSRVLEVFGDLVNRQRPKPEIATDTSCQWEPDWDNSWPKELIAPLRIDNQIVGYVCGLKNECVTQLISDSERAVFFTLSQQISAAIEGQRTREMLDSPYIAQALGPTERESFAGLSSVERPFRDPIKNPERLVRKIARQFFVDLRKAGFETDQILRIASEILDNLLAVLKKTKSSQPG